jgi:hypothetical protein
MIMASLHPRNVLDKKTMTALPVYDVGVEILPQNGGNRI